MLSGIRVVGVLREVVIVKHYLQSAAWKWKPYVWGGAIIAPASSSRWNSQGFSPTTHIASSHTSNYASSTVAEMGIYITTVAESVVCAVFALWPHRVLACMPRVHIASRSWHRSVGSTAPALRGRQRCRCWSVLGSVSMGLQQRQHVEASFF